MENPGKAARQKAGQVSPEERDEIRALYERKNALAELFKTMADWSRGDVETSPLYEKLVKDMGETTVRFQQWWNTKSLAYHWENRKGCSWEIDFSDGSIYIVKKIPG